MRMPAVVLGAAALFSITCTVANAADVRGTIKAIDPSAKAMTLSDGKSYEVAPTLKLDTFKTGDKVKVTYSVSGTKRAVSRIEAIK